ncbi:MAG TPA: amidase [Nocardioidaceae bacterium]|nr:amidase [Nocardioidaceae bacterium]
MTDLHELTALGLAAAFRRGDTTPSEAVDHFLDRVERFSDTVGAFVTVTADAAREAARNASERYRSGDVDALPALYGVPTGIKDLNLTAGVRTMLGSSVYAEFVPEESDEVVRRIEAAGLISLGKTNTPEFGSPPYTEPDVAPPARTPYDLTRSAGGSSGGSGAAVAARLVPIAQGSDGGGSIRIPASVCGLVGFKPTRGRISQAPLFGDVSGLSTAGPLATTVRDAAALLDALAGRHPGDPTWAPPLPDGETYLSWCDRSPGRLRIARFATPTIGTESVDPAVLEAYEAASALLTGLGHEVVDVEVPMSPAVVPIFETVWSVLACGWPVAPPLEPTLRPLTRWLRERGAATSGPAFTSALVQMRQAAAAALVRLHPYDAVLTPTLGQLPAPVGGIRNDDDPAADFEAQKRFTPFAAAWNVTGMPAVSLPTAWADGDPVLPVGTMLGGRPGEDHLLFALAAQVEAACTVAGGPPWGRPTPPLDG